MADMNQVSRINANVEVIEDYLKKEFENFSIAHRVDESLTYTFTVTDGKKRFNLFIGWPILAERSLNHAGIHRLVQANVAGEMRLRGKGGYHWRPSPEDTTQCGGG